MGILWSKKVWDPEKDVELKRILNRIYSTVSLDGLYSCASEEVRNFPQYQCYINFAVEEQQQRLSEEIQFVPFEQREAKARKIWLVLFLLNYVLNFLMLFISCLLEVPFLGNAAISPEAFILITIFLFIVLLGIIDGVYKEKRKGVLTFLIAFGASRLLSSFNRDLYDPDMWYISLLDLAFFGVYFFSLVHLRNIFSESQQRDQFSTFRHKLVEEPA